MFCFYKKWAIPGIFFLYFRLFNTVDGKQMFDISLRMTGFEQQISGNESNRSTNQATTTLIVFLFLKLEFLSFSNLLMWIQFKPKHFCNCLNNLRLFTLSIKWLCSQNPFDLFSLFWIFWWNQNSKNLPIMVPNAMPFPASFPLLLLNVK